MAVSSCRQPVGSATLYYCSATTECTPVGTTALASWARRESRIPNGQVSTQPRSGCPGGTGCGRLGRWTRDTLKPVPPRILGSRFPCFELLKSVVSVSQDSRVSLRLFRFPVPLLWETMSQSELRFSRQKKVPPLDFSDFQGRGRGRRLSSRSSGLYTSNLTMPRNIFCPNFKQKYNITFGHWGYCRNLEKKRAPVGSGEIAQWLRVRFLEPMCQFIITSRGSDVRGHQHTHICTQYLTRT